jgi:prefoldin alpha subunit
MEQLKERLERIDSKLAEAQELDRDLDSFKDVEEGSIAYVPLSSGMFVKAKILDTEHVKVNVGSGVVVEKDIQGAKELVHGHIEELQQLQSRAEDEYDDVIERADRLADKIA